MILPREANLGEEARTPLKMEGSTSKAGNPRLKMEFAHGTLGTSSLLFI